MENSMSIKTINERICKEICHVTIDKLKDSSLLDIYKECKSVKNQIKTAEIKLNSSSFSGELEGAMLTGVTSDTLGLYFNQFYLANDTLGEYIYIFPFGSKAYGGSSVPLNRFDNVRLLLTLATANASGCTVSVTCVGETTALYKGRASSLAMY